MDIRPVTDSVAQPTVKPDTPWFHRLSRPVLFLTISIALVGAYLAISIPVSVFPNTDFPRIVVGVDNGVMPIDQMLVTITRPLEEAVNSVPGLQRVTSVTSRGSAEVDLFFDWGSDMILTLQRVDAVVARLQAELPTTAKVETHRMTFAGFPIIGYSLTSDTVQRRQTLGNCHLRYQASFQQAQWRGLCFIQGGTGSGISDNASSGPLNFPPASPCRKFWTLFDAATWWIRRDCLNTIISLFWVWSAARCGRQSRSGRSW